MDWGSMLLWELAFYLEGWIPSLLNIVGYGVLVAGSIIVIGIVVKAFKKASR